MRTTTLLTLMALSACGSACRTSPVRPVPQPLPEAGDWELPAQGGAFLGLEARENMGQSFEDLAFAPGLKVTSVAAHSPAEAAGLRTGDLLLAWDGHETSAVATLDALLARALPDSEVELEVRRGDSVFAVPVKLTGGALSASAVPERLHRIDPARSRAAWRTASGGVELAASDPNAPFPKAGIGVGSIVLAVDGDPVVADLELVQRLQAEEPGSRVRVDYLDPDRERRSTDVQLYAPPTRITRAGVPVLLNYEADLEGTQESFVLLDLWVISLFRYERRESEKSWRFLRFFRFSSGVGELSE